MNAPLIHCPKCRAWLLEGVFNLPELSPCPACGAPLQIEVFPALFRQIAAGQSGETILVEGESTCFYHPQKKAVVPCDACGRFLCALCDCEMKGRHLCPSCLESGQKKQTIQGLEDERPLYRRQAFVLSILPFFITGVAAIVLAVRHWKTPGSLVAPMRWAMPAALILGSLQTLIYLGLIAYAMIR
jgi:hypothetical protein